MNEQVTIDLMPINPNENGIYNYSTWIGLDESDVILIEVEGYKE